MSYPVRTRLRVVALCLVALTVAACARPSRPAAEPAPAAAAGNALLDEQAREDQAVRRGGSAARNDEDRVKLVMGEIGAGRVRTPADRFNAALVLQHSPMTFRDGALAAISPNDYLLAHHLAKSAYEAGYERARLLVAQTLDRYLSLTAGYQKYGTNRFINQATGREELAPIDRNTTDAERAVYGVEPLAELLKRYPEAPRRTTPPPRPR